MFVIEVIPLIRGSHVESLSYYSSIAYETGAILNVPIRNKEAVAVVIGTKTVSKVKTALRAATFSLKKLPPQATVHILPSTLISVAKKLTETTPAKIGAIIYSLLPPEIRDGREIFPKSKLFSSSEPHVTTILEATREDRYISYKSLIRETFAHRGSVLFIVPTSADVERAEAILKSGIENRVVVFSKTKTKKAMRKAFELFADLRTAKLIIATPTHAYLDRHDITSVIIDSARSRHYKQKSRPFLDHREALKILAEITNRSLLMGDILPRSEEEKLRRDEVYLTYGEHPKRLALPSKLNIITQKDRPTHESPFALFSTKLIAAIEKNLKQRKSVFLFAARKGIAPVVACFDCGNIFRCPDSGAPYSLMRTFKNGEEERWFLSSTSGKRVRAADVCNQCGSWRLRERGIGIQHIHDELTQAFPNAPIFLFDHTTATTFRKAQEIIAKFYASKGAILLGTQMALPYLEKPVAMSAIVSLDSTRAIPTWRAEEELFGMLLALRENTVDTVYVQTRHEPDDVLKYAKQGQVELFYKDELALRKSLKYPPYAVFIHLTWKGTKEITEEIETGLEKVLKDYNPSFYSSPSSVDNKCTRYALIRISSKSWPDVKLMDILRTLPPSVRIEVNPDRIV